MDKYEYNLKLDQMKSFFAEEKYDEAAEIADSINWNKVKNTTALLRAGEIYEKTGRYADSRDVLLMAYDRSPIGRGIVFRLAEVAIKMEDYQAAQDYYDEFVEIAPHDNSKYMLRYDIKKAQGASYEELIPILEELREQEYTEEWAYELAYLYHKAGMSEKCIDACDELILWFGDGPYVERALELKMLYQPLTKAQEEKYRSFRQTKEGYTHINIEDLKRAGEYAYKPVEIPQVDVNQERFNTVNLQEEIARGMQQIIDATEKSTVTDTLDNINRIAEEIPYLMLPKEDSSAESGTHIETDEEIDGSLKINFQELLGEESDGQISLMMNERMQLEHQITGQITIEEVLEEWERTRRAAETALQEAEYRKLESAKARALQQAGGIMERLTDAIPKLDAGVTPRELLEQEYLQVRPETHEETAGPIEGDNGAEADAYGEAGMPVGAERYGEMDSPSGEDAYGEAGIEIITGEELQQGLYEEEPVAKDIFFSDPQFEGSQFEDPYMGADFAGEPYAGESAGSGLPAEEAFAEGYPQEVLLTEEYPPGEHLPEGYMPEEPLPEGYMSGEPLPEGYMTGEPLPEEYPAEEPSPEEYMTGEPLPEGYVPGEPSPEEYMTGEPLPEGYPAGGSLPEGYMPGEPLPEEYPAGEFLSGKPLPEQPVTEEYLAGEPLSEGTVPGESVPEEPLPAEPLSEVPSMEPLPGEDISENVPEQEPPAKEEQKREALTAEPPVEARMPGEGLPGRFRLNSGKKPAAENPKIVPERWRGKTLRIPDVKEPEDLGSDEVPDEEEVIEELTDEQKKTFSYFIPVKGMESQLCRALTGITRRIRAGQTAARGNLIIQGGQGCGKTTLATSMIKVLQDETGHPNDKIGKIQADAFNRKDIGQLIRKVAGGCLIIEQAGELSRESIVTLSLLLEQDTSGILIILEDTSKGIKKTLAQDEGFAKKFTEKITVPIFSNDELVAFARSYSKELGYEIDEMAVLALYNRISNIQRLDQATTLTEVKEIVDEAIKREARGGMKKYFSILTASRYTDDDLIVLREKDFE